MKYCPCCHFSLLALQVAQKIGHNKRTGICNKCENTEEILLTEIIDEAFDAISQNKTGQDN